MYETLLFSFFELFYSFAVRLCWPLYHAFFDVYFLCIVVFYHGVHLRSIRSNRSIEIQIPRLMLSFVVCRKDGEFTKPANEIRHSNVEFFEKICICLNRVDTHDFRADCSLNINEYFASFWM